MTTLTDEKLRELASLAEAAMPWSSDYWNQGGQIGAVDTFIDEVDPTTVAALVSELLELRDVVRRRLPRIISEARASSEREAAALREALADLRFAQDPDSGAQTIWLEGDSRVVDLDVIIALLAADPDASMRPAGEPEAEAAGTALQWGWCEQCGHNAWLRVAHRQAPR